MSDGQSYKVTEIEEAGLGIVSTRRILRGEMILQEKPLLLVESKIKENAYTWFDPKKQMTAMSYQPLIIFREEKTAYLRAKVSSLKKKDREKYYSLYDCKQEEGNTTQHAVKILLLIPNFVDLQVIKSQLLEYFVQITLPSGPLTTVQTTG